MRVVLTCDWFLKYAAAQAAGLSAAGAEVLLLCRSHAAEFGGDEAERAATLERARAAGVRLLEIPGRLSDPRAGGRLPAIWTSLRRFAPQVVHAHDGADPRAFVLLAGKPTVLTLHDPVAHPGQPAKPVHKRWFLHGYRDQWRARATLLIVHSQRLVPEVALRPGQRCAVVAHGLDLHPEPLPPPPSPTVAFFGRLEPYKGLDVLAQAMSLVWNHTPGVHLNVAGAGGAEVGPRDERVMVSRGYLPETELEAFFARASLAVLPYTQASQTGAGSLAVGFGVPVIVSRVGGLPDLALDPSYVVAPGDPAGLAGAILGHLGDGASVRARVHAELGRPRSWEAIGARTLELYRDLLARA